MHSPRLSLFSAFLLLSSIGIASATQTPGICRTQTAPPVDPAGSIIGSTPAEIQARFAGIIQQNLERGNTSLIIEILSSKELADLAELYGKATFGATAPLLDLFAKRLNAKDLQKVASTFGETATIEAVDLYTPTNVTISMDYWYVNGGGVSETC